MDFKYLPWISIDEHGILNISSILRPPQVYSRAMKDKSSVARVFSYERMSSTWGLLIKNEQGKKPNFFWTWGKRVRSGKMPWRQVK